MPQDQYLTYAPDKFSDIYGDPLYSFRVTTEPSSWFFCGYEHESSVDEGKYVIGNLKTADNSGTNTYMSFFDFEDKTGNQVSGLIGLAAAPLFWFTNGEFYVYYGEKVAIDAIKDKQEIQNGEVVSVTGGDLRTLAAGNTVTVKNGGVLSVGSTLFNDGTIRVEKGGTLLVREGSSITPWNTSMKVGNIVCDGGDVIVFSGGRVVCNGGGAELRSGAADGMIVSEPVEIAVEGESAVTVYRDGEAYEAENGVVSEAGEYAVNFVDGVTERRVMGFTVVGKSTNAVAAYSVPEGFLVSVATLDGEEAPYDRYRVDMMAEGAYHIEYRCPSAGLEKTLDVEIDRTAPELLLDGRVDGGGRVRSAVNLQARESGVTVGVTRNGEP